MRVLEERLDMKVGRDGSVIASQSATSCCLKAANLQVSHVVSQQHIIVTGFAAKNLKLVLSTEMVRYHEVIAT